MNNFSINFSDYLFIQFRTLTPTLEEVCKVYYPRLSRERKIDESQKAPYFVNLFDLSEFLIDALKIDKQYVNTNLQHACKDNH